MEEESNQDDISPVIVALRKYLMELSATLTDRTLITQGSELLEDVESFLALSREELAAASVSGIDRKAKLFIAKSSIFEIEDNKNEKSEALLAVFQVQMMKLLETFKEDEKNPSQMNQKEPDLPQKSTRKVIKRKFISANKSRGHFQCPHCDKSFVYIQSLSFHVKGEHANEGTKIVAKDFGGDQDEDDRTPCLMKNKKTGKLCNKLFQTHQMARHLKSHPEAESQPPKKKFKGFITSNSGESYEVVWRGPGEDNPPSEEEIEMSDTEEQDGTNFKQDDCHEDKRKVDLGDNVQKSEIEVDTPDSNDKDVSMMTKKVEDKVNIEVEEASKLVMEVKKLLSANVILEDSPPKLDVVLTEVTTDEKVPKLLLFDDTESQRLFTPPDPSEFVEIPSQSSQIKIEELEINSSFGLIKTQESELFELTFEDSQYQKGKGSNIENKEEEVKVNSDVLVSGDNDIDLTPSEEPSKLGPYLPSQFVKSQSLPELEGYYENEGNFVPVGPETTDRDRIVPSAVETSSSVEILDSDDQSPSEDPGTKVKRTVKVQYFTTKVKRGEFWVSSDLNANISIKLDNKKDKVLTDDARENSDLLVSEENDDQEEDTIEDANNNEDTAGVDDNEEDSEDEDSSTETCYLDTDFEMDDEEEFTNHRWEMKKVRRIKRDIATGFQEVSDRPGNETIINSFKEFLVRQCSDESKSTVSLTMGHMFYYNDSWLNLMTGKDRSFSLDRLLDFKDSRNFVTTPSPMNWLAVTGGPTGKDQPSRQLEQLKAHGRFRSFLEFKVNEEVFDGGEGIMKKLAFVQNNAAISAEIERLKIRNKLNKWYNFEKNKKRRMKQILNPETDINVYESVKTWFDSDEAKEKEEEAVSIWKKAIKSESKSVKQKDFNKVAVLSRFTTAVCDKSRPGAYLFKNSDYDSKTPVWFPEDSEEDIWSLDALPPNWRLYSPPGPNTEPTCFEIKLDGSQASLKGQAAVTVVVNKKSHQIMEMYQDLKRIVYKKQKKTMSMDDPFYVNFKLAPLSRLQRSKGNLLDLFGKVTQIPNFKMTDLRKAAEAVIQSRSALTEIGKDLNYHHENVVPVYDNLSSTRRMIFNTTLNNKEGSSAAKKIEDKDESIIDHLVEKKGREKDEETKRKEEAKLFLESEKLNKKVVDLTPFKFEEEILSFLRSLFNDYNLKDLDSAQLKKKFYRIVDSDETSAGINLRKIEAEVFATYKNSITREMKQKWTGSPSQHSYADLKIISVIKKSLAP